MSKRMEARERRLHGTGYWVDETIPALDDLLVPNGIDPLPFSKWLGQRLGIFRGNRSVKAARLTHSEEAQVLDSIRQKIASAIQAFAPLSIPPTADAGLVLLAFKHDENWFALTDRVRNDLITVGALMGAVVRDLRAQAQTRGRKPKADRDVLFTDLVHCVIEKAP